MEKNWKSISRNMENRLTVKYKVLQIFWARDNPTPGTSHSFRQELDDDSDDPEGWLSSAGPSNSKQLRWYVPASQRIPLKRKYPEDEEKRVVNRSRYCQEDDQDMIDYLIDYGKIAAAADAKSWVFLSESNRLSCARSAQSLAQHYKYRDYTDNELAREQFRNVSEAIRLKAYEAKKRKTTKNLR